MLIYDEKLIAWATLIGVALFVLARGGKVERWGYIAIAANWLLTPILQTRSSWFAPQYGIVIADAGLALILGGLALLTARLWPVAACAFETLGALARIAAIIAPATLTRAAYYADAVAGYLVFGALVGGIVIEAERQRRKAVDEV